MKKIKEEKGITLVALIITIVVLLILAIVAIGSLQESKIIGHAQNAAAGYNQAKNTEEKLLGNYVNTIEENMPKGEDGGITVNKLLNKAYANRFNSNSNVIYYLKENEGKIYLEAKKHDLTTDELTNAGTSVEVNLISEFETINITVNGSPIEISSKNAFFDQNSNYIYFTEDDIYIGLTDGRSYTTPCEYIYARNSSYDSKINN